jgi:hypothetical protein
MILNTGKAYCTKRGILCLSSELVRAMHEVIRYVTYYIYIATEISNE